MSDQTDVDQSGCPENPAGGARLAGLVELVIQRLALAQDVAAAKYGSGVPIDDPVRELKVFQSAAHTLNDVRLYEQIGIQFFRDQIEASKVIQRGLHHRWYRHPDEVPAANPDLAAEVRPKLDQITTEIIREFKCMNETPRFTHAEIIDLIDKQFAALPPSRQLPGLHRDAALFAMRAFFQAVSGRGRCSGIDRQGFRRGRWPGH
jgi:chorismate mutase